MIFIFVSTTDKSFYLPIVAQKYAYWQFWMKRRLLFIFYIMIFVSTTEELFIYVLLVRRSMCWVIRVLRIGNSNLRSISELTFCAEICAILMFIV